MEDTPTGADVVTTYKGTIEYQAAKSGQAAKHRTLASRRARSRPRRGLRRVLTRAATRGAGA